MEDLYAGWLGLADAAARLCGTVIEPLRKGRWPAYARYDWSIDRWGEQVRILRCDVLIIEGVGATQHRCRDQLDLAVWVQALPALRENRARTRQGQGDFARHSTQWAAQEDDLFGPDPYPQAPTGFDLIVDTTGAQTDV